MKELRQSSGRFQRRPYYTDGELERICTEALLDTGLLPSKPAAVRIERFVEKRFDCAPEYEALPKGILGFTEFGRRGVTRIVISNQLDDGSTVSRRRERSTLAHEAGHGLYHGHLFVTDEHPSFLPREASPSIMCREVLDARHDAASRTRVQQTTWYEFQANRAIGALLLPEKLVRQVAAPYLVAAGVFAEPELPVSKRSDLVDELAEVFDVNRPVAAIRIDQLYPINRSEQILF